MSKKVLNQDLEKELKQSWLITWFNFNPFDKEDKKGEEQVATSEEQPQTEETKNNEEMDKHSDENSNENSNNTEWEEVENESNKNESNEGEPNEGESNEGESSEGESNEDESNEASSEASNEEENSEDVDDVSGLVDLLDNIVGSDNLTEEEKNNIQDAKDQVEEAQKEVEQAEQNWDEKNVQEAKDKLQEELTSLNQKVEELWLQDKKNKTLIDKLKEVIDEKNKELSDYEIEKSEYWKTIDTIKNDKDVKWFVNLYAEYKWWNEDVKDKLIDSINKITEDTLWVDIKDLLTKEHAKQKEALAQKSKERLFEAQKKNENGDKLWFNWSFPH